VNEKAAALRAAIRTLCASPDGRLRDVGTRAAIKAAVVEAVPWLESVEVKDEPGRVNIVVRRTWRAWAVGWLPFFRGICSGAATELAVASAAEGVVVVGVDFVVTVDR